MAGRINARDDLSGDTISQEVKQEEDEEDFRSCCEDGEVWTEMEEAKKPESKYVLGEHSVKLFFKGISISMNESGDSVVGLSGIGVVMERLADLPTIQVQKKLDFYVEESVADYLALMDGLAEAIQHNARHVYAFTDSKMLCSQIVHGDEVEIPILKALRQRIRELIVDLDTFDLEVVDGAELKRSLQLAQVAVGVVSSTVKGDKSTHNCSICREEKPSPMTIAMKCLHKFCSHCMRTYVDGKVQSSQVPIRCPQPRCKYYVSLAECRHFLPLTSYESLEKALAEADVELHKLYCPYPNCSALLYPHECLSYRASTSGQSERNCIECPACQRFICVECRVPWHSSFTCEDYRNLPLDEGGDAADDMTLHHLAANNRWKRCRQCRRMIELAQGCYHTTCLCGHEFCYSCGTEYTDGQQTCRCVFWDEEDRSEGLISYSAQESEQWAWETFNSLPMITDAYSEQERSQLALIQRFLAGGFSLGDHCSYQQSSPPRCSDSYMDAMKDLHQVPWLQRFVSVISDDYYEEFLQ